MGLALGLLQVEFLSSFCSRVGFLVLWFPPDRRVTCQGCIPASQVLTTETDWGVGVVVLNYNNFAAFVGIPWSNTEVCVTEKKR